MIFCFYNRYKHLLTIDIERYNQGAMDHFCKVINASKGIHLDTCFAFIDGTFRASCRPSFNQEVAFSGHKRAHGIKFQSNMLPNGIIAEMDGPYLSKYHDTKILAKKDPQYNSYPMGREQFSIVNSMLSAPDSKARAPRSHPKSPVE